MKYHVLTAVLEGTDQREYYNKNVGGIRFYVPLERWEDPEWREKLAVNARINGRKSKGAPCQGPYKITFKTGKSVRVKNLRAWADRKGYGYQQLYKIANKYTEKDGYKRHKHKDIIGVERVTNDMGK